MELTPVVAWITGIKYMYLLELTPVVTLGNWYKVRVFTRLYTGPF